MKKFRLLLLLTSQISLADFAPAQAVKITCNKAVKVFQTAANGCESSKLLREKIDDLCAIDNSMAVNSISMGGTCSYYQGNLKLEGYKEAYGSCHIKSVHGSSSHSFQSYGYWKARALEHCKNRGTSLVSFEPILYKLY